MSHKNKPFFETIGFRSHDKVLETFVDIYVVGREKATSTSYRWNGMKRGDKETFIFQYTLSGIGAIDVEGRTYKLQPGQAFMVAVPGEHCYYLPEESEEWEFIFLTLKGQAASACWEKLTSQFGNVLDIPKKSELISHVFNIYQQAYDKDLIDQYYASTKAYAFIMECYRYFKQFKANGNLPDSVVRATNFIHTYFNTPLTIDDIANEANISKYYLIKLFSQTMNMTPIQYMTKIRLEKAFDLLSYSDYTIKDIALRVGYANDNYFNKVFRRVVGVSPGEFRKNKHSIPFNRLVIQ